MELSIRRAMSFWTYQTAQLSYVEFSWNNFNAGTN